MGRTAHHPFLELQSDILSQVCKLDLILLKQIQKLNFSFGSTKKTNPKKCDILSEKEGTNAHILKNTISS